MHMRHLRIQWLAAAAAIGLLVFLQTVRGQNIPRLPAGLPARVIGIPLHGATDEDLKAAIAANATIPTWTYNGASTRDGNTYNGKMVGADPTTSPNTSTSIPTQIIPLIVVTPEGITFDPTAPDSCA